MHVDVEVVHGALLFGMRLQVISHASTRTDDLAIRNQKFETVKNYLTNF
jgi:hypothetical protein